MNNTSIQTIRETRSHPRLRFRPFTLGAFATLSLLAGCTTEDPGIRSRQDQALQDPFSYGPADHVGKRQVPRGPAQPNNP